MNPGIEEAVAVRELYNKSAIPTWRPTWRAGSTEPWIVEVLSALVFANNCHRVVEIGGFEGFTSTKLALALSFLHQGELIVCEIDQQRAEQTQAALDAMKLVHTTARVVLSDSLQFIPTLDDESVDFVWLDGNHEKAHVAKEIELMLPKMRKNGIIAGHDVFGVCDLQEVFAHFGGYSLDLPRLGPAGGLGLLQVR